MVRTTIKRLGGYLPKKILTNEDIATKLDTSDAWIRQNTGIVKRHIVGPNEHTSDMAISAGKIALSGVDTATIDGVIVATSTPDRTMPACASRVQNVLGLSKAMAFDLQCACSGFLYAASVADSMIRSGQNRNILVIGADSMSKIVDWNDRTTCILFGDGAGACLLSATTDDSHIISSSLYTDGSFTEILQTSDGVSSHGTCGVLEMNGRAVFKHAIEKMHDALLKELEKNALTIDDVDWIVPHQANIRIAHGVAEKLQVDTKKLIITIDEHANTSAASIPLALSTANGQFKSGDLVALVAVGSGLSWGAMLIRW